MKNILYAIALTALTLTGCGGMDETYKELRGDGPIVYLGKFPDDAIQVSSGKERLKIALPPVTDIRVATGKLTWWSDGADHAKAFDVDPAGTEIIVDEHVPDGSYVFLLTLYDATDAYSSLATTINGVTYGKTYEAVQSGNNRVLDSVSRNVTTKRMYIRFYPADAPPLYATRVRWKENNNSAAWRDTLIGCYRKDGKTFSIDELVIPNFRSDSLAYSAILKPDTAFIDEFEIGPRYEREADHKDQYGEDADWTS
jgi:hypothetical protein